MNKMTLQEFAMMLDGRTLGNEITSEEEIMAEELGYVVVFGYSDDNAEFRGAYSDEIECYDGGRVYECNGFFINAVWDRAGIPWTYDTNIPHESFSVWDDEDASLYCQAIVFDIFEIKKNTEI